MFWRISSHTHNSPEARPMDSSQGIFDARSKNSDNRGSRFDSAPAHGERETIAGS
jgi:hypothetical protein